MMKTLPVILCFICLITVQLKAQDQEYERRFKLGIKAGLNLSSISDDAALAEDDAGVGAEFGIFTRMGERFYVQPGLEFSNQRRFLILNNPAGSLTERDALGINYLRVPVLVGLRTSYNGPVASHLRISAGPSFAYAIGVNDNKLGVAYSDIRKAQIGLNGGFGLDIWVLQLDLLYQHGLSTVFNYDDAEGKSRVVSFTVGLAL